MSEQDRLASRIPAEMLEDVVSWVLPKVQPKGDPILSSQREAENNGESEVPPAMNPEKEKIEDVEVEEQPQLTAEELSRISEEARQEGFAAGYKEGREKGEKEGHASGLKSGETKAFQQTLAKRNEEFKRLKSIADNLFQPMETQQEQLENILVEMAVSLAKQLMVQELQQNPASLYGIVKYALAALPAGGKNICIHLNGEDAELLQEFPASSQWQIQQDEAITRGGCKVSTEVSLVDFTLEPRITAYLEEVRLGGELDRADLPEVAVFRPEEKPERNMEEGDRGSTSELPSEPAELADKSKDLDSTAEEKADE